MARIRLGAFFVLVALLTIGFTVANRLLLHAALSDHVSVYADLGAALLLLVGGRLMIGAPQSSHPLAVRTTVGVVGVLLALGAVVADFLSLGLLYGVLPASSVIPPGAFALYKSAYTVSPFETDLLLVGVPLLIGILGILIIEQEFGR